MDCIAISFTFVYVDSQVDKICEFDIQIFGLTFRSCEDFWNSLS